MKRTTRILAMVSALLVAIAALVAMAGSAQADYPPGTAPGLNAPTGNLAAGGSGDLTGQGWQPGDDVNGTGASTPFSIGTVTANAQGQVHFTFTLPADITLGTHHFTVSDPANGDTASVAFEVTGSGVAATSEAAGGSAEGSGGGGSLAFTGVEIAGIVLGGLVLIVGGTLLVVAGRRRRSAHAA